MRVSVSELFREATGDATAHLVTRATGAAVRAAVVERLQGLERGEVLTLDFGGVGIIDFSCADERLAKLVLRLNAGEYGERYPLGTETAVPGGSGAWTPLAAAPGRALLGSARRTRAVVLCD